MVYFLKAVPGKFEQKCLFRTNRSYNSIFKLRGLIIFGWGNTVFISSDAGSKFQFLISNDVGNCNRVLELISLSLIGPVINLEVSQDRCAGIYVKEFMNVFIEMDG